MIGQSDNRRIYSSIESENKMNKHTKRNLLAVMLLALTASASALAADVTASMASHLTPENLAASGLLQAPGPSLVYFSDASYPLLTQNAKVLTSSASKAVILQAAKKSK